MEIHLLNIINIIIGVITIFIAFIYFKSKSFEPIPRFFNLMFCFIIIFNNFLRLYKPIETKGKDFSLLCKVQGFALSVFDKLFLTSIAIYSLITYILMTHPEYYENNNKCIYIIFIIINIITSLGFTTLFFLQGMSESIREKDRGLFCYINTDNDIKKISDSIYTGVLLIIDLFCFFKILYNIYSILKDCEDKNETKKKKLFEHLCRFIVALLLNIATFVFLFLIIWKVLDNINCISENNYIKDILFVIICFIDELFFTINKQFLKETKIILTCSGNKKQNHLDEEDNLYPSTVDVDRSQSSGEVEI